MELWGQPGLTAKVSHPLTHSPSSAGKGEKIGWESSRIEVKTMRLLYNYCSRQKRLKLGKSNLLTIKVDLGRLLFADGEYAAVCLCHSFLRRNSHFSSAPAWFPHGNQMELAVSSPGQTLASSHRSHHCQHLGTVTQYTDRPQRCIWVCRLAGLWLLHHAAAHFFLCLSTCASWQTVTSSTWGRSMRERL